MSYDLGGVVNDIGLMRSLVRECTHVEITKAALFLENASDAAYAYKLRLMQLGHTVTAAHYGKLSAMWGGGRDVALFTPMDALTCPIRDADISDEEFDIAVTSVISGLPLELVLWDTALMHAMRTRRTQGIIMALCARGACFAESEYDTALRLMGGDVPTDVLERVLLGLKRNGHDKFLNNTVVLNRATNDSGTVLHLCCSAPWNDIEDRIFMLLRFGVNPTTLSSISRTRAADMLMMHKTPETWRGLKQLTSCGAGPIRDHVREIDKLHLPVDVKNKIIEAALEGKR